MNPRAFFPYICAAFILMLCASRTAVAADFRLDDRVYIAGSVGIIRTAPRDEATIAAKMPIGVSAVFMGHPSDVASSPRQACLGVDAKTDGKWSCVEFYDLVVEQGSLSWSGWIATELLSSTQPTMRYLALQYDNTAEDDLSERRKWAERATALDPTDIESQRRLLHVLTKMNDTTTLEAATRSFANYRNRNVKSNSASKLLFVFNGNHLEPIWEFKSRNLVPREFSQDMNLEFRGRGNFYNLYSQGTQIGTVVTETLFDCRIQKCPLTTYARHINLDGALVTGSGIATTFDLSKEARSPIKFTAQHSATLRKMATAWINSQTGTLKYKKALRQSINQNGTNSFFIGTYTKSGKLILIGNWVVGSMNDQHYGSDDDIYESLLIIAEERNDGEFQLAHGSGSISENGCSYFDHLDIDGDGVDEIFLRCNQLEGSYNYSFLKRVGGIWLTPPNPRFPQ